MLIYQSDIVIWDSHPLALGATPKQVYIDGIAQITIPYTSPKPPTFQQLPPIPNFDKEAADAVKYEGLPPLEGKKIADKEIAFLNVHSMHIRDREHGGVMTIFDNSESEKGTGGNWTVVTRNGDVTCVQSAVEPGLSSCLPNFSNAGTEIIDLKGGSIAPGLTSFGSGLGLVEILLERSTADGNVYDPLTSAGVPSIVGGDQAIMRAVDGLQFGGRNTLQAVLYS